MTNLFKRRSFALLGIAVFLIGGFFVSGQALAVSSSAPKKLTIAEQIKQKAEEAAAKLEAAKKEAAEKLAAEIAKAKEAAEKLINSKVEISGDLNKIIPKSLELVKSNKGIAVDNNLVTEATKNITPITITLTNTGDKTAIFGVVKEVSPSSNIQLWTKDEAGNWYDFNIKGWGPLLGSKLDAGKSVAIEIYPIATVETTYKLKVYLAALGSGATFKEVAGNIVVDGTAPAAGKLTFITNSNPTPGIVIDKPVSSVYLLPNLSLDGVDVFNSLSVIVTDTNLNLTSVPVYINGTENGKMVYAAGVWNYQAGTRPDFSHGTQNLVAAFKDLAGNTTELTARFTTDNTAPVGGVLTIKTKLFPSGLTVAPINNVYSLPALSLDGVDVFNSLSVVANDTNLSTVSVPVYIDGIENGKMVYSGADGVWNYEAGYRPNFSTGVHDLVATFKDELGNETTLTAELTTDNTAPVGGTLTIKTTLFPDGITVDAPDEDGVYNIQALSLDGADVFGSLSVVVTDENLDTTSVPVFVDGEVNGEMVYTDGIWNYANQSIRPDFSTKDHTLSATFSDKSGNKKMLMAKFETDAAGPIGGALTIKTKLFSDGITVETPTKTGIYNIQDLSLDGADVFGSLSVIVTDDNLDTTSVPVYIDGSEIANGEMVYTDGVWNYTNQSERPTFSSGEHNLVATFKDIAGNTTTLTARFTTDNTAPVITVGNYNKKPTNQDIEVTVTASDGILNTESHVFEANGSFDFVATDAAGNVATKTVTITNIDKELPTAVATTPLTGAEKTITYTFSEPVQLVDQATGSSTPLSKDLLGIYSIDAKGNYGPTTVSGITITGAELNKNVLTVTYTGNLEKQVDTTYVIDAWGYNITDLVGNKIAKNDPNQIFTVSADTVAPIITIDDFDATTTVSSLTVTASTSEGILNEKSHTFTANSSFDFVAIDAAGNSATSTVTVSNISVPVRTTSGGGGGGGYIPSFNAPAGGFKVIINDNAAEATTTSVKLKLNGGSAAKMTISNTNDFSNLSQETYSNTKDWELSSGSGLKTVYVKFFDNYGTASSVIQSSITLNNGSVSEPVKQVLGEKKYADGTLLKGTNGRIYVVKGDTLLYISSLKELAKYKGIILKVTDSVIASFAKTAVLGVKKYADGTLIKAKGDVKVYVISYGTKVQIRSLAELRKYKGKIVIVTASELNNY